MGAVFIALTQQWDAQAECQQQIEAVTVIVMLHELQNVTGMILVKLFYEIFVTVSISEVLFQK
jgi:hypothetical protein